MMIRKKRFIPPFYFDFNYKRLAFLVQFKQKQHRKRSKHKGPRTSLIP